MKSSQDNLSAYQSKLLKAVLKMRFLNPILANLLLNKIQKFSVEDCKKILVELTSAKAMESDIIKNIAKNDPKKIRKIIDAEKKFGETLKAELEKRLKKGLEAQLENL